MSYEASIFCNGLYAAKSYVKRLYRKLDVVNRTEAARWGWDHGHVWTWKSCGGPASRCRRLRKNGTTAYHDDSIKTEVIRYE